MAESDDSGVVDPREFVRSVLRISPEDAEKVRDATPGTGKPGNRKPREDDDQDDELPRGQCGPTADYGEG